MLKFKLISSGLIGVAFFAAVVAPLGVSAASVPTTKSAASITSASASTFLPVSTVVIPNFNYGPNGGPSADTIVFNQGGLIQNGDVGYAVKQVQTQLNNSPFGYYVTVDGYFGTDTENEVKIFQSAYGLTADGKVGPQTLSYLDLWK